VQVRRHDDVFKDVPIASLVPVIDGIGHHFGKLGLAEPRIPLAAVEPTFHLGEDSAA
jgi:hypothetical protein